MPALRKKSPKIPKFKFVFSLLVIHKRTIRNIVLNVLDRI